MGACPFPVPQGSQVFLRDHARAFQAAGGAAHLIVYGYGVGEDTSGLPLHRSAKWNFARKTSAGPSPWKPLLDLAMVATVRRVVRDEKLVVLFAHNYEALIVALAAKACPVVYHAHNTMEDELPSYFGGAAWAARLGRWLDATFPRRADAVVAPHARLGEHLVSLGCAPDRVHVLHPPVWCEEFCDGGVGEALPAVAYTGNLDAYQNLPLLMTAMEILRARVPEARFRVLSHVEEKKNPLITPLGKGEAGASFVEFVQEDLQSFLARDIVVAVPRVSWSGYPVKILNAMAAGRPVVACDGAAHALRNGETGLVVPDNDAPALAVALEHLLKDPALRRQFGGNARAWVEANCQPKAVGEQLIAIARSAIPE